MYLRDFQICLRQHDPEKYLRLRAIWDPLELQIRRDIPKRFKFGGVGKIVLELGPEREARPQYRVLLEVGLYHYPVFDADRFLQLDTERQHAEFASIVRTSMTDLAQRFHAPIEWLPDSIAKAGFAGRLTSA